MRSARKLLGWPSAAADQVEDGIFGPLNRTERWRNWKSEPHDFLKGLLIGATTSCAD